MDPHLDKPRCSRPDVYVLFCIPKHSGVHEQPQTIITMQLQEALRFG